MKSILVLGGGQLGLMMAGDAARLGVTLDRVDTNNDLLLRGSSFRTSESISASVVGNYDAVTAEMEHLPDSPLVNDIRRQSQWVNETAFQNLVNRRDQKTLLDQLGLATSPWIALGSDADLDGAFRHCGKHLVVKTERGGYDGKGQWRISSANQSDLPDSVYGQAIAEALIPFTREVSLVGARNRQGRCFFYPLAENAHREGILRTSICGRPEKPELQQQAQEMLSCLMYHLNYVGVMAMECFDTGDRLLINEIAPRVHNSGHWSQLGATHSQFSLHVRALADLPFPDQPQYSRTLMLNLIGCEFDHRWLALDGAQCHWYGKEACRPGRKMGHINLDLDSGNRTDSTIKNLLPLVDEVHRQALQDAMESLSR